MYCTCVKTRKTDQLRIVWYRIRPATKLPSSDFYLIANCSAHTLVVFKALPARLPSPDVCGIPAVNLPRPDYFDIQLPRSDCFASPEAKLPTSDCRGIPAATLRLVWYSSGPAALPRLHYIGLLKSCIASQLGQV
jgi:hypothetical protein